MKNLHFILIIVAFTIITSCAEKDCPVCQKTEVFRMNNYVNTFIVQKLTNSGNTTLHTNTIDEMCMNMYNAGINQQILIDKAKLYNAAGDYILYELRNDYWDSYYSAILMVQNENRFYLMEKTNIVFGYYEFPDQNKDDNLTARGYFFVTVKD